MWKGLLSPRQVRMADTGQGQPERAEGTDIKSTKAQHVIRCSFVRQPLQAAQLPLRGLRAVGIKDGARQCIGCRKKVHA